MTCLKRLLTRWAKRREWIGRWRRIASRSFCGGEETRADWFRFFATALSRIQKVIVGCFEAVVLLRRWVVYFLEKTHLLQL